MISIQKLNEILNRLMSGDISPLSAENIADVSSEAVAILNKPEPLEVDDVVKMNLIISISQLVYNNTQREVLFLEDGVYDLLLELDKKYNPTVQVGAPEVSFNDGNSTLLGRKTASLNGLKSPMIFLDNVDRYNEQQLFKDELLASPPIDHSYFQMRRIDDRTREGNLSKKKVEVPHKYPKLVGTLDKCKFVLNKEAIDKGVYGDPNVIIFERDFLAKHLNMGLFDKSRVLTMVAEIKYDGVSVEAEVTDHILTAYSRGDTANNKAADLTPVLGGYKFHYCPEFLPGESPIGMKFEAMMLKRDVDYYSYYRNYDYANARNAITGLLGSSDACNYRDLITLIPLATSVEGLNRIEEIEFLNKYYNSGEYLRYAVLRGTYDQILFQVYRFEQEAEYLRPIMPMNYDGIVVSYVDEDIIEALGRKNFTNKYSIAIKFNAAKRNAVFTGYDYTVGQNGTITPMIHYTPVEFFGTIHDKSSGHSFKRFMDLGLKPGDILEIEYRNDVMPYVKKANCTQNDNNPNKPIPFPNRCPICGGEIMFSEKSAICINPSCPAKITAKVSNMMQKLGLKDFGDARLNELGINSFCEFINYPEENARHILGDIMGAKFMDRIRDIRNSPIYDYELMGAIGFSNIGKETWKKILNKVNLMNFTLFNDNDLEIALGGIRDVGPATIETIIRERPSFKEDISSIISCCNPVITYGMTSQSKGKVRITGFRDSKFIEDLNNLGFDASDSGVTKDTRFLVVPFDGFTSSKVEKAKKYGVQIVSVDEFKRNMM